MGERCAQELCPYWTGDGLVCACAVFGFDPAEDEWCSGCETVHETGGPCP